jgi:uncharacterized Rmd1/YagE family protein
MSGQNRTALFDGKESITASACLVGQRLRMKALKESDIVHSSPLMVEAGEGYAVLFRYGVIVFLGVSEQAQQDFIDSLEDKIIQPVTDVPPEETEISRDDRDGVRYNAVMVKDWHIDRLLIIADVLGKSQVLSYHEEQISSAFDRIEPIAGEMQRKGYPSGRRTRDLLRYIATTLAAQRNIAGQAQIQDKPDFLWDAPPSLEGLYIKLEDEYELRERHDALKEKLDLIYRTSEMMLSLMNSRHTLHVEWYIVILIIIDILIHMVETYIL